MMRTLRLCEGPSDHYVFLNIGMASGEVYCHWGLRILRVLIYINSKPGQLFLNRYRLNYNYNLRVADSGCLLPSVTLTIRTGW